jgi:hypothetical protein
LWVNGPPPPMTWTDDPCDEKVTLGWPVAEGLSVLANDWVKDLSEWGTFGRTIIEGERSKRASSTDERTSRGELTAL